MNVLRDAALGCGTIIGIAIVMIYVILTMVMCTSGELWAQDYTIEARGGMIIGRGRIERAVDSPYLDLMGVFYPTDHTLPRELPNDIQDKRRCNDTNHYLRALRNNLEAHGGNYPEAEHSIERAWCHD